MSPDLNAQLARDKNITVIPVMRNIGDDPVDHRVSHGTIQRLVVDLSSQGVLGTLFGSLLHLLPNLEILLDRGVSERRWSEVLSLFGGLK